MGSGSGRQKRIKASAPALEEEKHRFTYNNTTYVGGPGLEVRLMLKDIKNINLALDHNKWKAYLVKNDLASKSHARHYLGTRQQSYSTIDIEFVLNELLQDLYKNQCLRTMSYKGGHPPVDDLVYNHDDVFKSHLKIIVPEPRVVSQQIKLIDAKTGAQISWGSYHFTSDEMLVKKTNKIMNARLGTYRPYDYEATPHNLIQQLFKNMQPHGLSS